MMRILFAAGDVGGARAIEPTILAALARGWEAYVLCNGYLATQQLPDGARNVKVSDTPTFISETLASIAPDVVAFASSVFDTLPLQFAAVAKSTGVPVAHLLDNWSTYQDRLRLGDQFIQPELYAVMDDTAFNDAVQDNIDPRTLVITGTPALSGILPFAAEHSPSHRFVFVSEPVLADQGNDPSDPRYRGYIEDEVTELVVDALGTLDDQVSLGILPHPRHDLSLVARQIERMQARLNVQLLSSSERDAALAECDGVIGMSSILLYEMWLRGKPVASVQPGLRLDNLRMLASKPGLYFTDNRNEAVGGLARWAQSVSNYRPPEQAAIERARHRDAANTFLDRIQDLVIGPVPESQA